MITFDEDGFRTVAHRSCGHDDTLDGPCPGGPGHTDAWPWRVWDRISRLVCR